MSNFQNIFSEFHTDVNIDLVEGHVIGLILAKSPIVRAHAPKDLRGDVCRCCGHVKETPVETALPEKFSHKEVLMGAFADVESKDKVVKSVVTHPQNEMIEYFQSKEYFDRKRLDSEKETLWGASLVYSLYVPETTVILIPEDVGSVKDRHVLLRLNDILVVPFGLFPRL